MDTEFADVTELAGTQISAEQLERMAHRYHWAAQFCVNKDVVEVACGSGQGLGVLANVARSVEAGDYSATILKIPREHYRNRIALAQLDAQSLPYADASKDVVILFEAIYYVPDAQRFVNEARRVLRPGGKVLVATANKDLPDFNPSPLSHVYFGSADLVKLFRDSGFETEVYGYFPVQGLSWRQRLLRPVKRMAVGLGLVPRSMRGKELLKRLVFGKLVTMPLELEPAREPVAAPVKLPPDAPDRGHKVIYCCATLRS